MKNAVLTAMVRRTMLFLIAVQVISILFLSLNNEIYTWDETSYIINGIQLSKENLNPVLEKYIAFERHPLLSWIIAGAINIGLPVWSYNLISFFSLILLLLLTYRIGKEFFNKDVGLIAAFLLTTIPTVIILSAKVLTDIPSTFLFSFSFYLYYNGLKKPMNFLWGGLVGGLSVIMKDMNLLLIPILLVFLIIFWKKINKKYFLISAFVALVAMLPYFIDNYLRWGNPLYRIITHINIVNAGIGYQSLSILDYPVAWIIFLPFLVGLPIFLLFVKYVYKRKSLWHINSRLNFLLIWFFTPLFIFVLKQKISPRLIGIFLIPILVMGSNQLLMQKRWKFWLIMCLVMNGLFISSFIIYNQITLKPAHDELFAFIQEIVPEDKVVYTNASPPSILAWYSNRIFDFELNPDINNAVKYYLFDKTYEKYTQRTSLNSEHYNLLFENNRYTLYEKIY